MRPAASWKARPTHCARLCLTPQVRRKRKFDASTPSADGELRIRLDTASLALERKHLGPIVRAYDGINALALLIYYIPGPVAYGPLTACGHKPEYADNGIGRARCRRWRQPRLRSRRCTPRSSSSNS